MMKIKNISLSNRARRVCVLFALLFLGILGLYKVINPTLSLYGIVVAKYDGDIIIEVTEEGFFDLEKTVYYAMFQTDWFRMETKNIDKGATAKLHLDGLSERQYSSVSLGDEVKVRYSLFQIFNPDGIWFIEVTSIRKAVLHHPFPFSVAGMAFSEQEEDRTKELSAKILQDNIRAFVNYYNTEREMESCCTFVNSDIDGTFYYLRGYREDSGERYIALVTETIEGDEIVRTGEVYACAEISEVDGREMIVLSDESGENQRYVPLE